MQVTAAKLTRNKNCARYKGDFGELKFLTLVKVDRMRINRARRSVNTIPTTYVKMTILFVAPAMFCFCGL